MNLTLPLPDVLPDGAPHFFTDDYISQASGCTERKKVVSSAIQPERIAALPKLACSLNQNKNFNDSVIKQNTSLLRGLNYDTIRNVAEFADCCQSVSQNAGIRIFFRTQPSKTSAELPSMTTGLCSVRVKNKATGEATHLQNVKM